jgi:O-succinylbenzoic acid--CoA ligase
MREFPDWLHSRTSSVPDRIALVTGSQQWTFAELDAEADRAARILAANGVKTGSRVATVLGAGFTSAILPHALLRLGATLVPLNTRLTESEIDWQIHDIEPAIVIRDETLLSSAGEKDVELRLVHPADSTLAIIYTSGTTGQPKGAALTVGNFWWSAIGSALNLGIYPRDRWLACLPLFHVGGLSILMRSAIYGTTAVVHDGFNAGKVNHAIEHEDVSIVSVVAVMLERMLDAREQRPYPPSLRCVLLGGGPAPRSLLERCASLLIPVVQTYGLTETCSQVATLSPANAIRKLGSSGTPLYPNDVRISDNGEILVRGPVVMAGYVNKPDDTASAIVDGWLHTGDVGAIDDDGFLYVLDRRDDLIITGGENVYPAEVEAALTSHPAVAEAGVIGDTDPAWGQRVVAFVRLEDAESVDDKSLTAHCAAKLGAFKIPREFRFVSDPLPRTAAGKLRRSELRKMLPGSTVQSV